MKAFRRNGGKAASNLTESTGWRCVSASLYIYFFFTMWKSFAGGNKSLFFQSITTHFTEWYTPAIWSWYNAIKEWITLHKWSCASVTWLLTAHHTRSRLKSWWNIHMYAKISARFKCEVEAFWWIARAAVQQLRCFGPDQISSCFWREICLYLCHCCTKLRIPLPGYTRVGMLLIIVPLYNALI